MYYVRADLRTVTKFEPQKTQKRCKAGHSKFNLKARPDQTLTYAAAGLPGVLRPPTVASPPAKLCQNLFF